MPRAEAGTPKAISNAIKSKGLQKLCFFCQACQKQCRDANGFKCHMMSEAHQRQLLIVAENPNKFLEEYSKDFLRDFMQLFKTRFGGRRVYANEVYQEYIKDRYHVHMNSTRWLTLSAFVQWLGRNGYATVDQTERGWYITYIDRDPETLRREGNLKKKEKIERDYEEKQNKIIEKQIQKGLEAKDDSNNDEDEERKKELIRDTNEKIVLNLNLKNDKLFDKKQENSSPLFTINLSNKKTSELSNVQTSKSQKSLQPKKRSALDEILEEEILKKAKHSASIDSGWITEGIIVKIVSEKLPEKYRNKKGCIQKIENTYTAFVKLLENGAVIKCDQVHLESVIPREGNIVKIVKGPYKGVNATLLVVNISKLRCSVKIEQGPLKGKRLDDLQFDQICKIQS